MRLLKLLVAVSCACCGEAYALAIGGDAQLHAAVGAPLQVTLPVTFAGDEVSRVYYRLTPATGLADEEESAAASVHAAFNAAGPTILLTTSTRVAVPAIRLHLELGAGSVVVSRDLTILFDLPDLSKSAPLLDPAAAKAVSGVRGENSRAPAVPGVPAGSQSIAIRKEEEPAGPSVSFGDTGSPGDEKAATGGPHAVPFATLAPQPRYYNTYKVKPGDTLVSIAAHLARAGAGNSDAIMLAVFEANIEEFPAGNPQRPLVGHKLGIPDAAAVAGEPAYRIQEFKDYLRDPVGEWQVPVTLLPSKSEPATQVKAQQSFWSKPRTWIGAALLLLPLWGLQRLFAAGAYKRALKARRAWTASGSPAVQPNAFTAPPAESLRERHGSLAPPPQEAELGEIARLREMLAQQPGRADLRLRLALRLYEARNAASFAETALPLEAVLSPDAWERVRTMGHELLPSDFRFQPRTGVVPAPELVSLLQASTKARSVEADRMTIAFDQQAEMTKVENSRAKVFGDSGRQTA